MPRRLALAAAVTVLPFVLLGCGEKPQADPRSDAPLVRAATVQMAAAESRRFTGTVAARVQSDLGFRVHGKVLERLVDAGQSVKRGQPLMRIDPADLALAARAQQEAVSAARARATQTADDEARYRDLRGTGAIAATAYDQTKAAADSAQAQLRAAEAQAALARNASGYAVLVADADGVVLETLAEPGQVVGAGQVVARIAHAGKREAIIQLPETLRPALGSTASATLFGKEGAAVPAKLRQLSDTADRQTRTFEARYVLDAETDAPLGTTVTVQIAAAGTAAQAGMTVPLAALFDAGKGPGVWIIAGTPSKVSWRPVTVRGLGDDVARVDATLKQGDRIVALGSHLLREGAQVRVIGDTAANVAAVAAAGAQP